MKRYYFTPKSLPDWSNYFSQIIVVEKNGIKNIYLSGQVGVDCQKNLVGDGELPDQLQQAFINIQIALQNVNETIESIVKMNIYIVNYHPEDAQIIREAMHQYFKPCELPTMSLIGVQALAEPRFLVEIDAEAIVNSSN